MLYPSSGRPPDPTRGHDQLARALARPGEQPDPWPGLVAELGASPHEIAVISSGELQDLESVEQVTAVRERLAGHEVRVIARLRRQDELLHRRYCNAVLSGDESRPISEYRQSSVVGYDYRQLLAPWEEVFGREALDVRPHERGASDDEAVADLFGRLGLLADPELRRTPLAAKSRCYPRNVIECVRRMRLAGAGGEAIDDLIEVCGYVYDDLAADADILAPQRRAGLLARFQESNAQVARRYLDREDGRLFKDLGVGEQDEWLRRYRGRQSDVTVSIEDASAALARLG